MDNYLRDKEGNIIYTKDGKPRNKGGRPPKKVEVVEKSASLGHDKIREAARKRREDAKKYNENAGAFHGQQLVVKQKTGFYRRWVNDDTKGNLDRALQMGYYFVQENQLGEFIPTEDLGSRVVRKVGSKDGGGGLYAYLMEIPEEFYRESQDIKEMQLRNLEDQIRRGEGGGQGRLEQAYNPNPHSNNINEV